MLGRPSSPSETEREISLRGAVDSPVAGPVRQTEGYDPRRQNIVLSLAAPSGMGCSTSQCSTILPFSTRKRSTTAVPRSSGEFLEMTVRNDQIALSDHPLYVEA